MQRLCTGIGPHGLEETWREIAPKIVRVAREIKALGLGLIPSIVFFNSWAHSTLSYPLQFYPPNKFALKQERRAMQIITNGPYNALP